MTHQENGIKGMDISRWQGTIDWKKVEASEIEFVMIRAAYGESEDLQFKKNIEGALGVGLNVGVYQYSLAATVAEAKAEAAYIKQLLSPYHISYPVAYDVEDRRQESLSKEALTTLVLAYTEMVKAAGYLPALYGSANWLEHKYDSRIDSLDLWVAQWGSRLTFTGAAGIWQYSSTGRVSGVPVSVDLDLSYRDYASLVRTVGGKWQKDKKGWWYRFGDGSYPKSEWLRLDGRWYWFDERGYAVTGFYIVKGKPYYFATKTETENGYTVKECQCIITSASGVVQ